MAGELTKYQKISQALELIRGGKPPAPLAITPVVEVVRPVEERIRVVGPVAGDIALVAPPPIPMRNFAVVQPTFTGEIDLLVLCAKHDRMYAVRVAEHGGKIVNTGNVVRVTDDVFRTQYEGSARIEFMLDGHLEHSCPWCGVVNAGVILCTKCGWEVGRCRSINQYFKCRPSCGLESPLGVKIKSVRYGYIPWVA